MTNARVIIEFTCTCGNKFISDDPDVNTYVGECDMCGSHGDITIGATCPACKKYAETTLKEW